MPTLLYCLIRRGLSFEFVRTLGLGDSLVGRCQASDIMLLEINVSRKHARIRLTEQIATIRDLGSRNGTFVNGARIDEEVALSESDEIRIADYSLKVFFAVGEAIRVFGEFEESTRADSDQGCIGEKTSMTTPELTPGQRRVFDGFVDGLQEKEVAARLNISVHTVHSHAKAIYKKFEISSRAELMRRWASRQQFD